MVLNGLSQSALALWLVHDPVVGCQCIFHCGFSLGRSGVHCPQSNRLVPLSRVVSTGLDILPTLCDYAGIKSPEHLLGKSLRPITEGKRVDQWRTYVASENVWGRMIRSQRFKYCVYAGTNREESLVDMENDPGEMKNLVNKPRFQNVLFEHRKYLTEWSMLSDDKDSMQFVMIYN